MANCSFCGAGVGFSPVKINLGGNLFPMCTKCYMDYKYLISENPNAQVKAYNIFKDKTDYYSDDVKTEIDKIIDGMSESVKNAAEEEKKLAEKRSFIEENRDTLLKQLKLTTGTSFEGHSIKEYLGVVSGEVVMGTGFLSDFGSGFADFFGTKSTAYSGSMNDAKKAAVEIMEGQAIELGGNAIIGISFQYITFAVSNMIGVSVTGTAVQI